MKRLFKNKKLILGAVALAMVVVLAVCPVFEEKAKADTLTALEAKQRKLEKEMANLDKQLVSIVTEMDRLEDEVAGTQQEIDDTEAAIEEMNGTIANQYSSMKLRMKYMYENDQNSVVASFLEAGSVSELINKIEYASTVYEYDRDLMARYEGIQAELVEMEAALQEEKKTLAAKQVALEDKQASLDALMDSKKDELDNVEEQIVEAKRIAEEEERLRQQQENSSGAIGTANTSSISNAGVTATLNPGFVTGVSGGAVVAYANQFVGGRYVWGGTSLTNGCDCSGFVMGVYGHFGIKWGTRMTSGSFRSVGKEVSYNCMQPGDIVCYSGHVAIYAGNGKIVEAQSTNAGITNSRSVNCKSIITIRRVL